MGGTITAVSGNIMTITGHAFNHSGVPVQMSGSLPTGLSTLTTYYVIYLSANTYSLATTQANALAGTAITLSSTTTGGVVTQWADPDAATRIAPSTGGSTGVVAGSLQADQMQGHIHTETVVVSLTGSQLGPQGSATTTGTQSSALTTTVPVSDGTNGTPRAGRETRPSNVYVNFIIKY
jgi:hypothetical protein